MTLSKDRKQEIIKKYQRVKSDTGSSEVQIALQTERINYLTAHCTNNKKDRHSRYGLIKLVGKRRRLLDYLKRVNPDHYQRLIEQLEIRK